MKEGPRLVLTFYYLSVIILFDLTQPRWIAHLQSRGIGIMEFFINDLGETKLPLDGSYTQSDGSVTSRHKHFFLDLILLEAASLDNEASSQLTINLPDDYEMTPLQRKALKVLLGDKLYKQCMQSNRDEPVLHCTASDKRYIKRVITADLAEI